MNLSDLELEELTAGTAEFISSLPEKERLSAWRTFLKYAALLSRKSSASDRFCRSTQSLRSAQ